MQSVTMNHVLHSLAGSLSYLRSQGNLSNPDRMRVLRSQLAATSLALDVRKGYNPEEINVVSELAISSAAFVGENDPQIDDVLSQIERELVEISGRENAGELTAFLSG